MEHLKSYLDGELDLAQKTEVETHLRNDAELQKTVEDFQAISATLKTADAGEAYGFEKLEERLKSAGKVSPAETKKLYRLATFWSLGGLALALILFPVFAQSKSATKWTMGDSSAEAAASPSSDTKVMAKSGTPAPEFQERAKGLTEEGIQEDKSVNSWNDRKLNGQLPATNGSGDVVAGASDSTLPQQDAQASSTPLDNKYSAPGGGGGMAGRMPQANTSAPSSQWYDEGTRVARGGRDNDKSKSQFGATAPPLQPLNGKAMPESESRFKSEMRAERDKADQSVRTLNDTPHGIYLERSGQIRIKVEDLMRSVDETTGMVQGLDGFVVNHDLQNEENGGIATMLVRVPTKNYNAAMTKLQAMGEVLGVNSASQDITSETVDNSTRMISWADEEKRLIDELAKAKNNDQRYRIRQQLANVRVNLEAYRAQVKSLKERAEYSTIKIDFVRGDKADKVAGGSSNWSGNALKDAKGNLSSIGQVFGTMAIYGLVFTPIWLPFVIVAMIIRKKTRS